MAEPRRTCIACRTQAPTGGLVRIAWPAGSDGLVVGGTPGGRGAWVHPTGDCVAALRAERLSRALRRTVTTAQLSEVLDGLSEAPGGRSADT